MGNKSTYDMYTCIWGGVSHMQSKRKNELGLRESNAISESLNTKQRREIEENKFGKSKTCDLLDKTKMSQ